jgi:hypothetical protein
MRIDCGVRRGDLLGLALQGREIVDARREEETKMKAGAAALGIVAACAASGLLEAAHFQETGTSIIQETESQLVTLQGTCNWWWEGGTDTLTIAPDPGESIGDLVQLRWCVESRGEAAVTGPGYTAVGGVGGVAATVDCDGWTNPDPARVVLNPGPGEQEIFSYGPDEIFGGDPPLVFEDCSTVSARIGDVLQSEGKYFALVLGPGADPGTYVSLEYSVEIELQGRVIPTQGRWGIILLVSFIGLWSAWYLVRVSR